MKRSDTLDLEEGVFTKGSAREIAGSLKRSTMRSNRKLEMIDRLMQPPHY